MLNPSDDYSDDITNQKHNDLVDVDSTDSQVIEVKTTEPPGHTGILDKVCNYFKTKPEPEEIDWTQRVQKQGIPVSTDSTISVHTYQDTIKEWKKHLIKIAFIYDCAIDKYRKRVDFFTLLAFLLTSLASCLSLTNLGISTKCDSVVSIIFSALSFIIITLAAICTGLVKLRGWQNIVDEFQRYYDDVENFIASVVSEESVPQRFRIEPEIFINQQKEKYHYLLRSAPHMYQADYRGALARYRQSKKRFRHDLILI